MDSDPSDCLFGIRRPMDVYRLINELMDASVGPAVMQTGNEIQ